MLVRRVVVFSLLAFCLYIYLIYRPSNTIVQIVFRRIFSIEPLTYIQSKSLALPSWTVNSLPEGFWVFCMIWICDGFRTKKKFLYLCPLLFAIVLEGLQYFGLTDGTFDWIDIIFSIVFSLLAIPLLFWKKAKKANSSSIIYHKIMFFVGYLLVIFSDVVY